MVGEDLTIIEQFVIGMYDKTCPVYNVNQRRCMLYMRTIDGIQPTQSSLTQHIKLAMSQSR